jgi:2-methylfumaryl-CoA hydratase
MELPGQPDIGALRLRTIATKEKPCWDYPFKSPDGNYDAVVVLDFDYTVLIPRRA